MLKSLYTVDIVRKDQNGRDSNEEYEKMQIMATVQPTDNMSYNQFGILKQGALWISTETDFNLYGENDYYLTYDNRRYHLRDKEKFVQVLPHCEYTAYLEDENKAAGKRIEGIMI
jgi:hypothetical protein